MIGYGAIISRPLSVEIMHKQHLSQRLFSFCHIGGFLLVLQLVRYREASLCVSSSNKGLKKKGISLYFTPVK